MPSIAKPALTVEKVREILNYNPDTGFIYWKCRLPSRRKDLLAGTLTRAGYWQVSLMCKTYLAHRVAWALHYGAWPSAQVDHINRDRADNRIVNLRLATLEQQRANSVGWSLRGMPKGVAAHGPSFQAHFKGKAIGTFPTPELAHAAYCKVAASCYGDYFHSGEMPS